MEWECSDTVLTWRGSYIKIKKKKVHTTKLNVAVVPKDSVLCRKSFSTDYLNAKWQFAESLKDYKGQDNLHELIYEFLNIDDEYTERLALLSLAYIYPDKAEKYAIDFWHRDKYKDNDYENEYQKIMVLHVLHIIGSNKLKEYLDLADKSEYYYLKENSKKIREELNVMEEWKNLFVS